jgi:hypothetical protein
MTIVDEHYESDATTQQPVPIEVLEGVLRRVARSPLARRYVLRGSLYTRALVGGDAREAVDVDFLSLVRADVGETALRLGAALSADARDQVAFDFGSLRARMIWAETATPGVRVFVCAAFDGETHEVQIDVGFGDPLVPAGVPFVYTGGAGKIRLQACRPETLVAWKLHGLVELGRRRHRPKDLYDLALLVGRVTLDEAALLEAVPAAFWSHAMPVSRVVAALEDPFWLETEKSIRKWEAFRASARQHANASALECFSSVADALLPILRRRA